jgi:hypothetical protein
VTTLVIGNILFLILVPDFEILDEDFGEFGTQGCLHLSADLF